MRGALAVGVAIAALLVGAAAAAPSEALKARAAHHLGGRTGIVAFTTTPFPYLGALPDQSRPFLDARDGARQGHTSPRGGVHWADTTYASKDVLLSIPPGFDPDKPIVLLVFFHGNNATLERDVWHRQAVVAQLAQSHLNAVLIAPQFAVDALDSSAGNFWTAGVFAEFLAEASTRIAAFAGEPRLADRLVTAPVLLVAYSGGYNPSAYALTIGGARDRVCGVILLDALFGESAKFVWWIAHRGGAFFVSAYSASSQAENLALQEALHAQAIDLRPTLPDKAPIDPGLVAFVPAVQATHNDFVTSAWTAAPLRSLLSRVGSCRAGPASPSLRRPEPGAAEFTPSPGPGAQPASPFGILGHFLPPDLAPAP